MKRTLGTALVAPVIALILTGCAASPSDDEGSTDVPSPVETVAETTEAPPALSPGQDITIECHDSESEVFNNFSTPEEAWDSPREERESCGASYNSQDDLTDDSFFNKYTLTDKEHEAVDTAGYDEMKSVDTLYSICAEADMGDLEQYLPWSSSQIDEVNGALVLCPDHPDRKTVVERMAEGQEEEEARDRGEIFNDGTYKVGDDIQPGTYVAETDDAFDGCYWERLDSAGEIIDNNFVNSGFRVEVTISSSDYSFSAEHCGEWKKQ